MTCEIINIEGDLLTIQLGGVMSVAEQQATQRRVAELIDAGGKPRMLVVAKNFQGWSKKDDWGDMSFLMDYGDAVVKMAIVGDERWKDDALAFAGQGLRETEIEFFPPAELAEAERWVRA